MTDPVLGMLLAAVIADPDDDGPRLAYADRCLEVGDDDRAEFVRVQLELARLGNQPPPACGGYYCETWADGTAAHRGCRPSRLRSRAADLLGPRVASWAPPPFSGRAHDFGASGEVRFVAGPAVWGSLLFRRGFVGEVALPCAKWLRHGPALVRAAPLETVTLSDRRPAGRPTHSPLKTCWRWFDGSRAGGPDSWDPDELPGVLWPFYVAEMTERQQTWEHPGRADALDALSAAALRWARAVAPSAPAPVH